MKNYTQVYVKNSFEAAETYCKAFGAEITREFKNVDIQLNRVAASSTFHVLHIICGQQEKQAHEQQKTNGLGMRWKRYTMHIRKWDTEG